MIIIIYFLFIIIYFAILNRNKSIFDIINKKLKETERLFNICIKQNPYKYCKNITFDIYIDKYNKFNCYNSPCPIFPINNTQLNTDVLYQLHFINIPDYLFIVQIGPSEIVARMMFRKLFKKYNTLLNNEINYIFFMGKPYYEKINKKKIHDISLNLLIDELNTFNDMIIFNFTNSYYSITLQLFLMYKWIVDSRIKIKKIIRFDSNTLVYNNKLLFLLKRNYDLQAYPCYTKDFYSKLIKYPQGSFHILSINLIYLLIKYYNKSDIVKSNDQTTGLIIYNLIKRNISLKLYWFSNKEVDLLIGCHNYEININNDTIALHPLTIPSMNYFINLKSY